MNNDALTFHIAPSILAISFRKLILLQEILSQNIVFFPHRNIYFVHSLNPI